uniref:Peptidase_M13_N domain-containing protein n=1 Tax=Angiostrongylus cantonensis TaxID=6313 RepID=A0A0K0DLT5_ANGCA
MNSLVGTGKQDFAKCAPLHNSMLFNYKLMAKSEWKAALFFPRFNEHFSEILESSKVPKSKPARIVKAMYRKCMDKEQLTRIGVKNLLAAIRVQLLHKDASIPVNQKQIESDVGEIMDFESKLAKIMVADEDQRNHTKNYNLRNLSEMQALIPSINWNHFFYSITPPAVHSYLAADPEIVIHEIDYMKRLAKLLISTDSVIVTNYVYVCYFLKWEGELGGRYAAVAKVCWKPLK